MNKLKPAFKFFFTLLRLNKLIVGNIIFSVFGISMFVLSGFNIGEIGSENYLVDIIWVVFGYWMILEMLILSLSATFQTKAVQSMPYIEAIYKKVLPLIAFSVNIIIAAINITSMLIALNSGEIVLQAISDRLVILAFLSFITYVCLGMCTKPGGAIVFMTPFVLVPNFIILLPKDLLPIFTEASTFRLQHQS